MKLLQDVKEEFFFATYNVDKLISAYLIKKLGMESMEAMSNLGLKGRSKFESRLDLLMQLKSLNKDKKKKLEIFTEIYNIMMLKKKDFSTNSEEYYSFLIKNYPQKENLGSSDRASNILREFILDVQRMVKNITSIHNLETRTKDAVSTFVGNA